MDLTMEWQKRKGRNEFCFHPESESERERVMPNVGGYRA
jgi:hypothetical protein